MDKLTLEKAQGMTYSDCVRHFKPSASQGEIEIILWSHTCFPLDNKIMIRQLNEYFLGPDEK